LASIAASIAASPMCVRLTPTRVLPVPASASARHRKPDADHRALTVPAANRDLPAVTDDNDTDQGEPDTGTSGTGKNSAANLYWGHKPLSSTSYVWNNSGKEGKETATLKNASGKTIDSRSYTGRSVSGAAQVSCKP
jgi:hypothetical protein